MIIKNERPQKSIRNFPPHTDFSLISHNICDFLFFFPTPSHFQHLLQFTHPLRAIILYFESTGYIPACRGPLPYSANGWQHGVRRDGRAGE